MSSDLLSQCALTADINWGHRYRYTDSVYLAAAPDTHCSSNRNKTSNGWIYTP